MILAFAAMVAAQATRPPDWRAIARSDVAAAYREFAGNHPGMKNPADPGFPARLAAARDAALKIADTTSGLPGYRRALDVFSEGLADGHALVYAIKGEGDDPGEMVWPGFIAAWRGNEELVFHAGPTSPAPVGSAIIACDGRLITEVMRANSSGMWFRPAEAGQWWQIGPLSFIGKSPPTTEQPRRCSFRLADGSIHDLALLWTPMPNEAFDIVGKAVAGERTPIGLSEVRPDVYLVGLPTFSPDADGVRAFEKLYSDVDRRRADLRRAKAIVLDLRFNNGGSSEWSAELARHLWGKAAVDARIDAYFRKVRIWWRASPANVAVMAEREAMIRRNRQIRIADETHVVAQGMKAALAAGRPYYVEVPVKSRNRHRQMPVTNLKTPVYVITDGGCMSACLDAVDVFKRFATVKLIGAPTSADTNYIDVRRAALPSGEGRIVIPLKVWMNRPRGSGQVYIPDIAFNQLDWSTSAFLDRVEQDLISSRAN